MDIVVDIQFFKGIEGPILPKEIAIIALDNEFQYLCVLKSPYNSSKILSNLYRQNKWLTQHQHG